MKILTIIVSLLIFTTALAVSPSLVSFNGGQVSPLLEARVDFPKYLSSCRTIENMLVTVQGPVERRSGTKFIAAQGSSSAAGRIIGFERSADESYILLFEDQTLRFFINGGQIVEGTGVENISDLDNIVAHWLCNEDEGLTVINDNDPGTHDGTLSVDAQVVAVDGKVGTGAFDLDGQYDVTIADHDDFSFTDDSDDTPFSIACWGFATRQDDIQVLLSKWQDGGSAKEWRLALTSESKLRLSLADTGIGLGGDVIGHWRMNETGASPTLDNDEGTAGLDATLSKNANILTATSKSTQLSTCIDFGGSEEAVISDAAALSFGNATNDEPFSISAEIYVVGSSSNRHIFGKYDGTTASKDREYRFYLNNEEKLVFTLYDESTNGAVQAIAPIPLTSGWHHVVATYNGSESNPEGGISLYVDRNFQAQLVTKTVGTYVAMEAGDTDAAIGAVQGSGGTYTANWLDKIDNVILFNKEISTAEVSTLYNSGDGTEDLGSIEIFTETDDIISDGWHFFAVTYSAPSDETTAADGIILYIDGVAVDSTATNDEGYVATQNGGSGVRIGSQRNVGNSANEKFWDDKVDEISIYGDVLTPTEVASLLSTTPFEIATPYRSADLSGLNVTKNDDIMYIAHPDYKPKLLSSTGFTLWTLEDIDFQTGPFLFENDTATTIAADGTTGSIILTASESIFKKSEGASHIGSIWQINQVGGNPSISATFTSNGISIATKNFIGGYSFTTTDENWEGTITLQRSTNDGISWRPALTPLTDANFDNPGEIEEDGAMYRVVATNRSAGSLTFNLTVHDETNRGVVRITGVESSTSATATVLSTLVSTSTTTQWREGYWSDFRGWPKTVTVHQQRLVFGGSVSFPQTVWWGRQDPDEYENFLEGTLDTSAFTVELEGQNPIRWLLSQDYMLIGTSGTIGKWGEQGQAVTPTSPNYQEQTRHGSAEIGAGLGGDAVLYVERGSRKVRQFSFDLQVDKYLSPDLTILAPEITESGIVEIAFQLRPDPILWCVLGNGDIATLTYQQDQSIAAWTKQITDGDFRSVAIIPGQTGTNEDEVWVIAERVIDSDSVFYVEQFQPQEWGSDPNNAWFVDSGVFYDGDSTDTFTGADHLEGETVSIYADRLIESPEIVVSGGFTIDNAASRVLVGMPYTSKLETLPLVIDPQDKVANKKVRVVWFDVYRTGAFEYGNGANSDLTNFNFKNNLDRDNTATAKDLDVDPATSIVKPLPVSWPYGSMKKQTIFVQSDEPMPLTIRAITTNYKFYGN